MGDSWARRTASPAAASPAAVLELKDREAGRVLAYRLRLKAEQTFAAPVSKGGNSGLRELENSAGAPPHSSPSTPTAAGEAGEPVTPPAM